jgi:exonuclease III
MIIGTWNVRSIRNKISEVTKELLEMKVDVRSNNRKQKERGRQQYHWRISTFLVWSRQIQRAKSGVSLFIKTKYKKLEKSI